MRRFAQNPSLNYLLSTSWYFPLQVVLVDNQYAAIGGLDLCFGRWDTHTHPLADVHPTEFSKTLFPGQDFNNARILDFKDVYDYVSNTLSIEETARMPWHDVSFNSFRLPSLIETFLGPYDSIRRCCTRYFSTLYWALEWGQKAKGMLPLQYFLIIVFWTFVQYRHDEWGFILHHRPVIDLVWSMYAWLALPHDPDYAPNEAVARTLRFSALYSL